VDPVVNQLEAYNARDIERFIACYDPEVRIEDGEGNLLMPGHDSMRAQYSSLFIASPNLQAHLLNRIVVGDYVIDEEDVSGRIAEGYPEKVRAVAIYRIVGDKIVHVRFLW
jgi:hypothetical protein